MKERGAITHRLATFIANAKHEGLPDDVADYSKLLIFDGIGTLASATHPSVAASAGVIRDKGEFEQKFPDFYIGKVTLELAIGRPACRAFGGAA